MCVIFEKYIKLFKIFVRPYEVVNSKTLLKIFTLLMVICLNFLFFSNAFTSNFMKNTTNFSYDILPLFSNNLSELTSKFYDSLIRTTPLYFIFLSHDFTSIHISELDILDSNTINFAYFLLYSMVENENFINWFKDIFLFDVTVNLPIQGAISINTIELKFFIEENIVNMFQNQPMQSIFFPEFIEKVIKNGIISAIVLSTFFSFYLKEKIFYFFIVNFLLILIMLGNLNKLYSSLNLIYALLHFLIFAVTSGLLIIFWGSYYLGFCVLLIYGAAIPVLALYIIMLVNVDLIQRLFFFEHVSKAKFSDNNKKLFLYLFLINYFFICFKNIDTSLLESQQPLLLELHKNFKYFFLMKRHFLINEFPTSSTNIYDLVLTFYSSDLDKVASAAFKSSYNELLALVFLLLIAIVVVISISGVLITKLPQTSLQFTINFKPVNLNLIAFFIVFKLKLIEIIRSFFGSKEISKIHANGYNSLFDPIFLYILRSGAISLLPDTYQNINMSNGLAVMATDPIDPWTEWYDVYAVDTLDEKYESAETSGEYVELDLKSVTHEDKVVSKTTAKFFV